MRSGRDGEEIVEYATGGGEKQGEVGRSKEKQGEERRSGGK